MLRSRVIENKHFSRSSYKLTTRHESPRRYRISWKMRVKFVPVRVRFFSRKKAQRCFAGGLWSAAARWLQDESGALSLPLSLSLHKLPVHLNSPPGTVTILLHVVLLSDTPHPLPQETSRLQTRIIIPSRLPPVTGVGLLRIFCIVRNPCPRLRKLSGPILHRVFVTLGVRDQNLFIYLFFLLDYCARGIRMNAVRCVNFGSLMGLCGTINRTACVIL